MRLGMKVLYLTGIPAPYRVELFNEMGKYIDLTVAFLGKNQRFREKNWISEKIIAFKPVFLNQKNFENRIDFSALRYLKKNSMQFDYIVIHGYSSWAAISSIIYLKARGIPFALEADGGIIKKESTIKKRIKTELIKAASAWLSSGKMTTEFFMHYGAKNEKIFVYPFTSIHKEDILQMPVPQDRKDSLRSELNIKEKQIILSVGQMIHRKGFDILIKSFNMGWLESVGLYIIGGTPTERLLLLAKDNPHIHFLPFMAKDKLQKYYQASDIYVFPTREDIWGLVVNEALANALPVISTDQSVAAVEMLPQCCLIPSENSDILYQKCKELLANDRMRMDLSEQAIEISLQYTIEESAKRHCEILTYLLQ